MLSPSDLLAPLRLSMERDFPDVVVLVGTGISIGASAVPEASWLGLLRHGVEHLVATDVFARSHGDRVLADLQHAFNPFDLNRALEHAQNVEFNLNTLGSEPYEEWLRIAFSELKSKPERSEALETLRDLASSGALLATTNYDNLLVDATGLPPVTWQEHDRLLRVVRRDEPGILHIHGHWSQPESIILGRDSYNRIVADASFQDFLKSLWLTNSWVYVGSGGGLGDPNLGRLLEWSRGWKKEQQPDYFLGREGDTPQNDDPASSSTNLIPVPYADHPDLPGLLRSILPETRCWPFIPIDDGFPQYRAEGGEDDIPFPSRAEYRAGKVPMLAADAEVKARLEEHGWAYVLDVASVGKTTLALRMRAEPEQRDGPAYYIDLSQHADGPLAEITEALRRLTRPGTLLIVDNAHHAPEISRGLWDAWMHTPNHGRLLLIASRTFQTVTLTPAHDIGFFEFHPTNPAISLQPTPEDLWAIVEHMDERLRHRADRPLVRPDDSVLQQWHADYGAALGGFTVSAMARLHAFHKGQWTLRPEDASDWVRERWLRRLRPQALQNVLCLAAFGEQELELQVPVEALPFPNSTRQLGLLAVRTKLGRHGEYVRLSLREPGWGRLILATHDLQTDTTALRFEAASSNTALATVLAHRLKRAQNNVQLGAFWDYCGSHPDGLTSSVTEVGLTIADQLLRACHRERRLDLTGLLWSAIESDLERLAEKAWATPLHFVASFLNAAKAHGRDTDALWTAIESEPERLAEQAWATPLGHVTSFLNVAKAHGRDTDALWSAVESDLERLADQVWIAPLSDVAWFLYSSTAHDRSADALWSAIESNPQRLGRMAKQSDDDSVERFLWSAIHAGRDINRINRIIHFN